MILMASSSLMMGACSNDLDELMTEGMNEKLQQAVDVTNLFAVKFVEVGTEFSTGPNQFALKELQDKLFELTSTPDDFGPDSALLVKVLENYIQYIKGNNESIHAAYVSAYELNIQYGEDSTALLLTTIETAKENVDSYVPEPEVEEPEVDKGEWNSVGHGIEPDENMPEGTEIITPDDVSDYNFEAAEDQSVAAISILTFNLMMGRLMSDVSLVDDEDFKFELFDFSTTISGTETDMHGDRYNLNYLSYAAEDVARYLDERDPAYLSSAKKMIDQVSLDNEMNGTLLSINGMIDEVIKQLN